MAELVVLGILFLPPIAWIVYKVYERQGEARRRRERDLERVEHLRVQGCHEVLLDFLNELGYLARESIGREELAGFIESGMGPEDLAEAVWERCEALPGAILGHRDLGDVRIPVKLLDRLRARHLYLVGRSGSGKTTLIRNLVLQDLANGYGLAVLAPEAELLTQEILPFIPSERLPDVIYVNPADLERPVPFNPLHLAPGEDLDLKVDQTFTVFRRLFGEGHAPRMDAILRNALHLLVELPGTTFLDMEALLDRNDASFRLGAAARSSDERVRHFWQETYATYPKDAHLPLVNRLQRLLGPRVVRSLLCGSAESLELRRAMDEGKILLFNLSDGLLGEANAELLGQLVVANLQLAAWSRADMPPEERRPFYVYLDEFQTFCGTMGASYERLLSRARKYGLGLILAHQQTGQVPDSVLKEIFGNVSTMISFAVSSGDAGRLASNFVGERDGAAFTPEHADFLTLRTGQALARIERSVFRMQTLPPPPAEAADYGLRDAAIASSRKRYGRPVALPAAARLDDLDPRQVF